jgi:hypothetical protein
MTEAGSYIAHTSLFTRLTAAAVVAALTIGTVAPPALAQGAPAAGAAKAPDKKTKDAARKAYGEGEKAYDRSTKAYDSFQKPGLIDASRQYWIAVSCKQGKDERPPPRSKVNNPDRRRPARRSPKPKRAYEIKAKRSASSIWRPPAGATVTVDGKAQRRDDGELVSAAQADDLVAGSRRSRYNQQPPARRRESQLTLAPATRGPRPGCATETQPPPLASAPQRCRLRDARDSRRQRCSRRSSASRRSAPERLRRQSDGGRADDVEQNA